MHIYVEYYSNQTNPRHLKSKCYLNKLLVFKTGAARVKESTGKQARKRRQANCPVLIFNKRAIHSDKVAVKSASLLPEKAFVSCSMAAWLCKPQRRREDDQCWPIARPTSQTLAWLWASVSLTSPTGRYCCQRVHLSSVDGCIPRLVFMELVWLSVMHVPHLLNMHDHGCVTQYQLVIPCLSTSIGSVLLQLFSCPARQRLCLYIIIHLLVKLKMFFWDQTCAYTSILVSVFIQWHLLMNEWWLLDW